MKINKSNTSLKLGRNLVITATSLVLISTAEAVTVSHIASEESLDIFQLMDYETFLPSGFNTTARVSSTFQQAGIFDINFGDLGVTTISFTLEAPTGFDFEIDTPTSGSSNVTIEISYGDGVFTSGSPNGSGNAPLVGGNSSGSPLPSNGDFARYSIDGDNSGNQGFAGQPSASFSSRILLTPGERHQFKTITGTIEIPASVEEDFSFFNGQLSFARLVGRNEGSSTSQGQWVSLVPSAAVPEPSGILLISFGLLGSIFRRRR